MIIKKLRLENFRKFSEVEVPLKQFTVLMGENSSGKTTVLRAIALSLRLLNDQITQPEGKGKIYSSLPAMALEDPRNLFYQKSNPSKGAKIIIWDEKDQKHEMLIRYLFGAFNVKVTRQIRRPMGKPLFISGFVGIPINEERMFPVAMSDRISRGQASQVLRNLLIDLKDSLPDRYSQMDKMLRKRFGFFIENRSVHFDPNRDLSLHIKFLDRTTTSGRVTKQVSLDLSSSGSGYLQVLQILSSIYFYAGGGTKIVLIDEPDAHLHPNLQVELIRSLQEISNDLDLQIVMSTHSPAIIREVSPDLVLPVNTQEKQLHFLKVPQEVDEYIHDNIDSFVLGKVQSRRKILFIEDKNIAILKRIDEVVNSGIFGRSDIPVVSYKGKDDKMPFRIKPFLKEIAGLEVEVYILRDRDGLPQEWITKIEQYAKDKDVNLHVLRLHEIESYLINPSCILRALQSSHQGCGITEEEIENLLVETMRDVIVQIPFGFNNVLADGIYKIGRLVGEDMNLQRAYAEARDIIDKYRELGTLAELKEVAPAKETLTEFRKRLSEFQQQKSESCKAPSLSTRVLLKYLQIEDIDSDFVKFLTSVAREKT